MKPTRPALRYFGGKWRLADWIISHFPEHRVYVEPFGGAASVLLQKPRVNFEVYNDLDDLVVDVFRVLQDPEKAEQLKSMLTYTPFARREYELAQDRGESLCEIERCRRTIIRSFMGHGSNSISEVSGFRGRGIRQNTPPQVDWTRYPDAIASFVDRLRGVVIESRPAVRVIAAHDDPQTLFYVDPPYVHSTRGRRHDYRHEMTNDDHLELAAALHDVQGFVVLSGYESDLYADLYGDWECVRRHARADGAEANRIEVIWLNPAASNGKPQEQLFTHESQ